MLPSLARLLVSARDREWLPDDILDTIDEIVGSDDPCNGLRKLCETRRDLCSEDIYRAACSHFRYDTEAIRDAFLNTRPAHIRNAAANIRWRVCFRQLCARPKLTDDTIDEAIRKAATTNWVHERYGHISFWDVSGVTNMEAAFCFLHVKFNENLTLWDVSSVTNMAHMFDNAETFNQPLNWDVSSVTNMEGMFKSAFAFNQPLKWDVSRVTNMARMFDDAQTFNQPLKWDVSSVTDMYHMFFEASAFNQPLDWDVSSVTNMRGMFCHAEAFNQPLNWDVSRVENMNYMFDNSAQDPPPVWYNAA